MPSVNIGDRQKGRVMPPSVIQCSTSLNDIHRAIQFGLSEKHKGVAERKDTPYGTSGSSKLIEGVLEEFDLSEILIKNFWDL